MPKKPKTIRDLPDVEFLRRLDLAMRKSRPAIRRAYAEAIETLIAELPMGEIQTALEEGRIESMLSGTPWEAFERRLATTLGATDEIRELVEDGDLAELSKLNAGEVLRTWFSAVDGALATSPIDPDWDWEEVIRRQALVYVDGHGAALVTTVSEQTKGAIRELVRHAYSQPSHVEGLQRALLSLRDGNGEPRLGLSARQQQIFERWIDANNAPGGPWSNMSQRGIQQQIDRRFRRMRRYRGQLIAHTEAHTAGNAAQDATWREAAAADTIDTDLYVLEWVTRLINVCRRCIAMDRATREISGGVFVSDGSGPKGVERVKHPDLHPGGYCGVRVTTRRDAQPVRMAA